MTPPSRRCSSECSNRQPGPPPTKAPLAAVKGKPLPDLGSLGFAPTDTPKGKPILIVLIDAEQRPCRRSLRLLADQAPALEELEAKLAELK